MAGTTMQVHTPSSSRPMMTKQKSKSRLRRNATPTRSALKSPGALSPKPSAKVRIDASSTPQQIKGTERKSSSKSLVTADTMEDSGNRMDGTATLPVKVTALSPTKEEEDNRVVEITEFHECIDGHDWSELEKLLKKFDGKYYKRKREQDARRKELLQQQEEEEKREQEEQDDANSTSSPKAPGSPGKFRRRMVKMMSARTLSPGAALKENAEPIVSPLLKVDPRGRTPLHLAALEGCPEPILLMLLKAEKLAASRSDDMGQLPLHLAIESRQFDHILDRFIKAYPNGLKTKDIQSRSPIGFAVELACRMSEEDKGEQNTGHLYHWGTPISEAEKNWQFEQIKRWSKVEYLVKDLMRRNKCVLPSEHGLLLEALEGGAPPKTINRFISSTDKYLLEDDDLSGSALVLCIRRQYSLDTLQYLVENAREKTTMMIDYTQKALVNHYQKGCIPVGPKKQSFGKEITEWCKQPENQPTIEDVSDSPEEEEKEDSKEAQSQVPVSPDIPQRPAPLFKDASVQCQEWWAVLRYLLFYAAHGKNFEEKDDKRKDEHLLHAALSSSTVPPSLIQLFQVIFPQSLSISCPTYRAQPIHLACTRWKYDLLRSDKDISMEKVLKKFLKQEKGQVVRRFRGRLPLHLALAVGQSWGFVKPFVSLDKKSVGKRDPETRLFPFQLAALKLPQKNIALLLRNRYTPSQWRNTPQNEKREEFENASKMQSRRQIGTIFELLKKHPEAIQGKYLVDDYAKKNTVLKNAGLISTHYLRWAYFPLPNGWHLNPKNVRMLRDSVVNGYVVESLKPWWKKLQTLIWQGIPSGLVPQEGEYLLHAALYGADTPPLVIELILSIFPQSAAKPIPGTETYPLHIAAGTMAYHPQDFEIEYSMDNLTLTLNAFRSAVRLCVDGRLPIHMCLSRGKTWQEVKPLVKEDSRTLQIRDPVSGLAPFQLIATFKINSIDSSLRFKKMSDKYTQSIEMDKLSVTQKAQVFRNLKRNYDLDVLSSVFELLRRRPSAIDSTRVFSTTTSNDDVSVMTSSVHSIPEENAGISASLEQAVWDAAKSPNFLSPGTLDAKSLSFYLSKQNTGASLISTHRRMRQSSGSLSTSQHSLVSRGAGSVASRFSGNGIDDFRRPIYDDDDASTMQSSIASSLSPGESSPGRFKRRGRKPKLPSIPVLDSGI